MGRKMKDSGIEWIGEIPEDWNVIISRFVIDSITDVDHYMPESHDDGVPYLMIGDLREKVSDIDFVGCKKISGYDYNILEKKSKPTKGDLIFARYATIGTVTYVDEDRDFLVSYACVNIHPSNSIDGKYLFFLMKSSAFIEEVSQYMRSNTQGNVGIEAIYNSRLVVPPIRKQQEIATYLELKCNEIESVIKKTNASIGKYKSLKQSLITRAVTKGVRGKRDMKDSGIEWIGEVPTDWKIVNLKRTGTFDNGLTYSPTDVKDDGVLVLRSSNIQEGKLDYKDCVYVGEVPDNLIVKKGDIIICSRNGSAKLVGKCALVNDEVNATFGAFMMRYRTKLNNMFAYYLLQVAITENRYLFTTTTINQLTRGIIGQIKVPYPKESEQQEIVDYLDEKCSAIDTLIAKKEQLLSELETYKKSLIYEYVTGKREVPV